MGPALVGLAPVDWAAAQAGFGGGLMIGTASASMLLGLGRIAGVSGLAARALGLAPAGPPRPVALAFVIGLSLGAGAVALLVHPVAARFPASVPILALGGLAVGFGVRMGGGCTSGHGVCGLSRLSPRSMAATAGFMLAGFATVAVLRLVGIGT